MQEANAYSLTNKDFAYSWPMDRARKLILEKSQEGGGKGRLKEWSIELGRNHAYLQQFIHRGKPLELEEADRINLSRILSVPEESLRGPVLSKLDTPRRPGSYKPLTLNKDEFRFIGGHDQPTSAGNGSFIQDASHTPKYTLAFRRDWLQSITSAGDQDLFVLYVDGDSMEPTIHHGDTVLVDRTQRNPRRDGIYVLVWDNLLNVKRVSSDPRRKSLTITSDNKNYAAWKNIKAPEIEVVGRVIWIGRRV